MSSLISSEQWVPAGHPLGRVKKLADDVLAALSATFDAIYGPTGRTSIPPKRLAEVPAALTHRVIPALTV